MDQACNDQARAIAQAARPGVPLQCDEYPYYASNAAGPGAALRFIRASDNFNEGLKYGAFVRGCPPVSAAPVEADRDAFLVVPHTFVPTAWVC